MFNKKGDHVDWAISMGIFLLYLIGLFILLRPGVTPTYKPEGLLQILETNLMNEITYEVREIPLFVKKCIGTVDSNAPGGFQSTIITIEDNTNPKNFEFGTWDVIDTTSKKNIFGSELKCGMDETNPPFIKENTMYYITYHQINQGKIEADITVKCTPNDIKVCEFRLGASTSKTGIKNIWINRLKPEVGREKETYEALKTRWKIPLDFAIYYDDLNNKIIGGQEPEGVNIFSKEIKTNELSDSGILTPKTIIIQVW